MTLEPGVGDLAEDRTRRIEELMGRPVSVRRFELQAALAVAHALGDSVVADEPPQGCRSRARFNSGFLREGVTQTRP